MQNLNLVVDDSGTRLALAKRRDKSRFDAFALGGYIYKDEDAEAIISGVDNLKAQFGITYPLRSYDIRSEKNQWDWLNKDRTKKLSFLADLERLICSLPIHCIACTIDRAGYTARYEPIYGESRWNLCKSAYTILVERAAKFAIRCGRRLHVLVEKSGKKEDSRIAEYHRALRESPSIFDPDRSKVYDPLAIQDFQRTLFVRPRFVAKSNPRAQIADLVLYPMARGSYDANYRPFLALQNSNKLVEAVLEQEHRTSMGSKKYCF